jgi:hypothetical protein
MRPCESFDHIDGFWSDTYRGRRIAILRHLGAWHIYLDDILQDRVVFATPDKAVAWLVHRVDGSVPDTLTNYLHSRLAGATQRTRETADAI